MKKNEEKTSVLFLENGPIQVTGTVKISGQYGEKETKDSIYLCCCGEAINKPYCNVSHRANGFKG